MPEMITAIKTSRYNNMAMQPPSFCLTWTAQLICVFCEFHYGTIKKRGSKKLQNYKTQRSADLKIAKQNIMLFFSGKQI